MAIAQLIFKKGNFIGEIELDVIIREGASASARITKNPVQNGADVNDHIIIDPMTFTMQGVVSDTKLNALGDIGVASRVATATSALTRTNTPSKEAWEQLLLLHASKTTFDLIQNLKTYQNVAFQSITEVQDKDTSNGLFFTATFSVINFVGATILSAFQFNDTNIADQAVPATVGGQKTLGTL